ncbi:MAG: glucokinase [Kordiimonadaceae bacterium]|nr:glucokinase [Kordiimonadaceae bacterium]
MLKQYFLEHEDARPKKACLAVAGPMNGDSSRITNLG